MYIVLDPSAPAAAFDALSRGIASDALLILDGEAVTIATPAGLIDAYGDDDETPIAIIGQAGGHEAAIGADAAMRLRADPAEAARWLAVWLDPDLA